MPFVVASRSRPGRWAHVAFASLSQAQTHFNHLDADLPRAIVGVDAEAPEKTKIVVQSPGDERDALQARAMACAAMHVFGLSGEFWQVADVYRDVSGVDCLREVTVVHSVPGSAPMAFAVTSVASASLTKSALEAACKLVSSAATAPSTPTIRRPYQAGSVCTPVFRTRTDSTSSEYVFAMPSTTGSGRPAFFFVCHEVGLDTQTLTDFVPFTMQAKRVALARAMATVHSLGSLSLPPFEIDSSRLVDEFSAQMGTAAPDVAARLGMIKSQECGAIDNLIRFSGLARANVANVVLGGKVPHPGVFKEDTLSLVGLESLVPISRLWDLSFLVLMDESASGISFRIPSLGLGLAHEGQWQWAHDVASALRVYFSHQGAPFTKEEVALFPAVLVLQALSLKQCPPDRTLSVVRWIAEHAPTLRRLLASTNEGVYLAIPHLNLDDDSPALIPGIVQRCASAVADGRRPVLLWMSGLFAPVHAGHIATMVAAAGLAEMRLGRVVGTVFSPYHQSHADAKLGPLYARFFTATRRVSLLNLAIHSAAGAHRGLQQLNPIVDTHEVRHCRIDDQSRITCAAQRLKRSVNAVSAAAPLPILCLVMGDDGIDVDRVTNELCSLDSAVVCLVSLRSDGNPGNEGNSRVMWFKAEGKARSATRLRQALVDSKPVQNKESVLLQEIGIDSVAARVIGIKI